MKQNELDAIKQAILNEIEGYEFYQLAASQAKDDETKQSFLNLANEEMKHVEWLKALFNSMVNDDHDSFNLANVSDPPSPEIYQWKHLDRQNAQTAVSVFGIGMQMEQLAVKFYTEARDQATHDHVKALFTKLIAWEQVHFEQFAKEYDLLKQDWWSTQSFAPF